MHGEYSGYPSSSEESTFAVEEALIALDAANEALKAWMRTYALDNVEAGNLTRRKAGELLNVHPITISRWLTAREIEQSDPAAS